MKIRFCTALLLAAFCITLLSGCSSVNAMPRLSPALDITVPSEQAPLAPTPAATPAQSSVTEAKQITKDEAVSIALKHAGLKEEQVTRLRTEFDHNDGRPEYEVDFHHGVYEYDYEIHAVTGDIITWDKDLED